MKAVKRFMHGLLGHQSRTQMELQLVWTDGTQRRECSCGALFYWEPRGNLSFLRIGQSPEDDRLIKDTPEDLQ